MHPGSPVYREGISRTLIWINPPNSLAIHCADLGAASARMSPISDRVTPAVSWHHRQPAGAGVRSDGRGLGRRCHRGRQCCCIGGGSPERQANGPGSNSLDTTGNAMKLRRSGRRRQSISTIRPKSAAIQSCQPVRPQGRSHKRRSPESAMGRPDAPISDRNMSCGHHHPSGHWPRTGGNI
jgi:hypothetical protein